MKISRLLSALLAAAMVICLFAAPGALAYGFTGETDDYDQVIVFVHTNDVHGAVAVEPYVAAVAAEMRAAYGEENVIVANAGDTWGGATIASLSNGEYIAPIMNAVPYDVMTLGNDDIGRGTEQALKVMGMNDFSTLSAGWIDAETGEHLADACAVFDCGGQIDTLTFNRRSDFQIPVLDDEINFALAEKSALANQKILLKPAHRLRRAL